MDDTFFMNNFDALDHLDGNVENSLEVKLMMAFLEKVLQGLAELIHNHNMVHLAVFSFLISNEMKIRYCGLSSKFVDELGLPKEHDMLLILDCFLNLGSKVVTGLLFLYSVDLTKSTSAKFLDNFVSLVQYFLSVFEHFVFIIINLIKNNFQKYIIYISS